MAGIEFANIAMKSVNRVFVVVAALAVGTGGLSSVRRPVARALSRGGAVCAAAPLGGLTDDGDAPKEGKRQMAKRLWNRLGRKTAGEGEDAPEVLDEAASADLYAAFNARKDEVDAPTVEDGEIYDALERQADFPTVAKKLTEALANRSLTTGGLPPVLAAEDFSDFAPSSGQTPGEVISGVLKALREGALRADRVLAASSGVATLLRFMSPASSFGSESDVDDAAFIEFVAESEYDILFKWESMRFDKNIRLSFDGKKAFQQVLLLDEESKDWARVKWQLSLRDRADCKESCKSEEDVWLVDNVSVAPR